MKATITLADTETMVVDIDARDRRAWEREARSYIDNLPQGDLRTVAAAMPETYVAWLAWHACGREGLTRLSWQTFEGQLLEVDSDEETGTGGLPDPTQATPTVA